MGHYTGKGIREIYKSNITVEEKKVSAELQAKSEAYLTDNNYIAWAPLDAIIDINR